MFGYQLLGFMYLSHLLGPAVSHPIWAAFNAGMCYVGPQRGEMCIHPHVKPKHLVPHVCLLLVSTAALLVQV